MADNKTSDAQIRASRNWENRNRKKATIDGYRRTARMFIRKHAKEEDLRELEGLIEAKRKEMESN